MSTPLLKQVLIISRRRIRTFWGDAVPKLLRGYYFSMRFCSKNVAMTNEMENPRESVGKYFINKKRKPKTTKSGKRTQMAKITENTENRLQYIKHIHGKYLSEIVDSKSSASIEKTGTIFLESQKLIDIALRGGLQIQSVYMSEPDMIHKSAYSDLNTKFYHVLHKDLKNWVTNKHIQPKGILCAVAKKPDLHMGDMKPDQIPVTLVLDSITDPDCLGIILQTALGVGVRHIITTKESFNVWDPRVIASAEGAHFFLPVSANLSWEQLLDHIRNVENSEVFFSTSSHSLWRKIIQALDNAEDNDEDVDRNDDNEEDFEEQNIGDDDDDEELAKQRLRQSKTIYEVDFSKEDNAVIVLSDRKRIGRKEVQFLIGSRAQFVTLPTVKSVKNVSPVAAGSVVLYEIYKQIKI